jgi:tRNA modification GTPase
VNSVVETITALATPPGRGGVAIVRVSGPNVRSIIQTLLGCQLTPRHAHYLTFKDENGNALDEGLALFFPNPHSFTGEDVLELQGHGGPVVADLLMQEIIKQGARLARPGEFSERAFLNGKMDLAQAEAVADLINASSKQAAQSALRSLQGEFSKEVTAINEQIVLLRMYVEAAIDFTDEEIDFLSDAKLNKQFKDLFAALTTVQEKARQGSLLREGITVVIAGAPNVGKSSLLNALSGKELAIVTDIPGTTRDVLRDHILIDGMPLHIVDTAGLRASDDIVEQEGIRRAYKEMEQADLVMYLIGPDDAPVAGQEFVVRNKIDLTQEQPSVRARDDNIIISLSAKTGAGLDLLKQQIKSKIGYHGETDGIYLARRRHLDALDRAAHHVKQGLTQLTDAKSGELAAEDLRLAHLALCEITGQFSADDLLGKIFSSFCIGK